MRRVGKCLKLQSRWVLRIHAKPLVCVLTLQVLKEEKPHLPHLPAVRVLLLPVRRWITG